MISSRGQPEKAIVFIVARTAYANLLTTVHLVNSGDKWLVVGVVSDPRGTWGWKDEYEIGYKTTPYNDRLPIRVGTPLM